MEPKAQAAMATSLLWHVRLSHFNEKARRALDCKCIGQPLVRTFPTFCGLRNKISSTTLKADRATVNAALDRIEQERQGRR